MTMIIFEIFSQTILVCIGDGILMLDLVRLTLGFVYLEHGIHDNVRIPKGSVVAEFEWSLERCKCVLNGCPSRMIATRLIAVTIFLSESTVIILQDVCQLRCRSSFQTTA